MKDHFDLVLDVGNTRTKIGWVRHGRIVRTATLVDAGEQQLGELLGDQRPVSIAIGSVAAPSDHVIAYLARLAPVLEVTGTTPLPMVNGYATPGTLGVDRIANAVAACRMFPGRPVLVIDAGTCITYDLVEADGTFVGGAISPGKRMRAKAMHAYSARLPLEEAGDEPVLVGDSTLAALASGIHHGTHSEMRGMIHAFGHDRPRMAVILTGGDALGSARALKSGIFAHPLLTLEGLHAILVHNRDTHGIAGNPSAAWRKGPGAAG